MAYKLQTLHKLQTKIEELNRLQDAWMAILNPFMRRSPVPPRYRATAADSGDYPIMPAAPDPTQPGAEIDQPMIRVVADGMPEKLMVCLKKADGSYVWVQAAVAP